MKKRKIKKIIINNNASFPVLETLISIGICVTLLTVFLTSLNNTYNIEKRPEIDLYEKSLGILEQLISTQGQIYKENPCWEGFSDDINILGLGTSPTVAYGILYYDKINNEIIIIGDQNSNSNDDIGFINHCFLDGTIVYTENGPTCIQDLNCGNTVKAYDFENEKIEDAEVINIFDFTSDYMESSNYITLNGLLRVTTDHKFYSEGKWVSADNLNIDDCLFCHSGVCQVENKDTTTATENVHDLDVAEYNNYFVQIGDLEGDPIYVLVEDYSELLYADFTWFDTDGLDNQQLIDFDASSSLGDISSDSYKWDMDNDGDFGQDDNPDDPEGETINNYNLENNDPHIISLKITKGEIEHICTKIVQANKYIPPNLEDWIETDFVEIPETGLNTFASYDQRYYVKYSDLNDLGINYYIYEVKEKNYNYYSILDFDKIEELGKISENEDIYEDIYNDFKSDFGLETIDVLYNFHITINRQEGLPITFGASYENINVMQSISKDVLIYHRPETSGYDIIKSPSYEKARVTVRVFIGGYFE